MYGFRDCLRRINEGFARKFLAIFLATLSSRFLTQYLNAGIDLAAWLVLTSLICMSVNAIEKDAVCMAARLAILALSIAFTASLVLGKHIVVGDAYSGLSDVNYISRYSSFDAIAFAFMLPGVYSIMLAPIAKLGSRPVIFAEGEASDFGICPLGFKHVTRFAAIIFVLWLPYLVVYWPGAILTDSLSSISQALGLAGGWNNHHPVAYTLFLAVCLRISGALGFANTVGLAISTVLQMLFMSMAFGYLSRWLVVRLDMKNAFGFALALFFGMCSYLASFSIALWKDPIFSSAGLLLCLCLADLAWSKGTVSTGRGWRLLYFVSSILFVFFRNNGLYILLFMLAYFGLRYAFLRVRGIVTKKYRTSSLITLLVIVLYLIISGPVFSLLNIEPSEYSETVGLPLNQMARVAALGGEMTESDREYLSLVMPFDEYSNHYYPCCVDNLKWANEFNNEALKNGFWYHWFSMLVRNPYAYFEAWELQTFGFWTVNTEEQCAVSPKATSGWSWNLSGGVVHNVSEDYAANLESIGISVNSAALSADVEQYLPLDSWSIPIGWLFWLTVYLLVLLVVTGRASWIVGLLPSLALLGTLIIATPICYWPRYGALLQFSFPYYVALFLLAFKESLSREVLQNSVGRAISKLVN